ncbi:MAG: type II toxin-antitoxin system HicB family antitoxin [Euryarchaeota archaeon]|nr:type II toxin-antitoxin system HicB family antitoxin [Euryarchaeota archaeon]
MKRRFTVVIEKDPGGGYVASVAELPGCHTQGDTLKELRANVKEAIELYLENEDLDAKFPEFVGIERVAVAGIDRRGRSAR